VKNQQILMDIGPRSLLAIAALVTIAGPGYAQNGRGPAAAPVQRVVVQITQVKPELVDVYQDAIKTMLLPAVKKANLASFIWTWANGASGEAFTFAQVRPLANFADLDQPNQLQRAMGADGVAKLNAKTRPAIVSRHTYIQTVRQDMSIQNSATPPPLAVVQIFQVAPGKANDFVTSMTSDYLPSFRKAGVKDLWTYVENFGGPAGRVVTLRPLAKYAELDEPGLLNKAGLSQDAIQKINERRNAIATVIDNDLVRFVPDLSFGTLPRSGN